MVHNNKEKQAIDRKKVDYHSRRCNTIFYGLLCISSVISVVNTHLLSLSFRCLKRRNNAHLYSRCKVRVTRNANINCHYEVRRKEMRPRGKEINLLVCQNAFSFLGLKLIPSHTNRV